MLQPASRGQEPEARGARSQEEEERGER